MRKIINNTRATLRFILIAIWGICFLVLLIIVAVISKLTLRKNKARMALAQSFFNSFIRGSVWSNSINLDGLLEIRILSVFEFIFFS